RVAAGLCRGARCDPGARGEAHERGVVGMRSIVIGLVMALGVGTAACDHGSAPGGTATATSTDMSSPSAVAIPAAVIHISWRAMAVAGDDSASVFDNAVDAMQQLLAARGVTRIDRLTTDPMMARADRPI